MDKNHLCDIVEFYRILAKLKDIKRRGWVLRDIPLGESVSDHTFGVTVLTMFMAERYSLDVEKAMKTSLIHEVGETEIGDLTPEDDVPPEEKRKKEEAAAERILNNVDPSGELLGLWRDFEYSRTPEGRLVKEIDKFEMGLQAASYGEKHPEFDKDEFLRSSLAALDHKELKEIIEKLKG